MSVNVLRKASTKEDLQGLAKSLIKNWKKLLGIKLKMLYCLLFKFECFGFSKCCQYRQGYRSHVPLQIIIYKIYHFCKELGFLDCLYFDK